MFWGTAVCQGMTPAQHWASVGLLVGLPASKLTLQSAGKTSHRSHNSIKRFLHFVTFGIRRWAPVGHEA